MSKGVLLSRLVAVLFSACLDPRAHADGTADEQPWLV